MRRCKKTGNTNVKHSLIQVTKIVLSAMASRMRNTIESAENSKRIDLKLINNVKQSSDHGVNLIELKSGLFQWLI